METLPRNPITYGRKPSSSSDCGVFQYVESIILKVYGQLVLFSLSFFSSFIVSRLVSSYTFLECSSGSSVLILLSGEITKF